MFSPAILHGRVGNNPVIKMTGLTEGLGGEEVEFFGAEEVLELLEGGQFELANPFLSELKLFSDLLERFFLFL